MIELGTWILYSEVTTKEEARKEAEGLDEDDATPWTEHYPQEAATIVIHHSAILRNKRLLLAYQ